MADHKSSKQLTLAITGASGAPYALRLLQVLLAAEIQVHLVISSAARVVMATEEDLKLPGHPEALQKFLCERYACSSDLLRVYGKDDWFSPIASGSAAPKQMVICPASLGSVAAVAHGTSDSLIERAADVVLKERGQLIVVPREAPFSTLHLENLLALSRLGATILPAAPGFYHNPQSIEDLIDFIVARILDHLGIEQVLVPGWGYNSQHS